MTEIERLRFYLRDTSATGRFFTDSEMAELLSATDSFEEAVALGWVIKASGTATGATTAATVSAKTIGKVRKEYDTSGGATTATMLSMASYWYRKAGIGGARWMEMQPDKGFIAESLDIIKALETVESADLSRLIAIGW